MRPHRAASIPLIVLTIAAAGCGAGENPDTAAKRAPPGAPPALPAMDVVARTLVQRAAGVREGERVLISGSTRDEELLEAIAIEVKKLGGDPLVTLTSERMRRAFFDEVEPRHDTVIAWGRTLTEAADVHIYVDDVETPDLLAHVPPERLAATFEQANEIVEISSRRKARIVTLGNDLYPTHARAARFGISRDELARYFWAGATAEPSQMERTGEQFRALLSTAREIRITHPNGTDFTVGLDRPRILVNDGTVSEEDRERRGGNMVFLPAGEVIFSIAPGTARGTIVADRYDYQGTLARDLRLTFVDGRLTSMTAGAGIEGLRASYEASGAGRDLITTLDFGFNRSIPATGDIRTWIAAGTVTPGIGNDLWAGGTNGSAFAIAPFLTGTTVTVDGRTIIRDGELIFP